MEIVGASFADVYNEIRGVFFYCPEKVNEIAPRGFITKEISEPLHIELLNPRSRLCWHEKRGYSLPFAVAETLLLYSEEDKLKYFTWTNKRMEQFSDDGETLYGAYGLRMGPALEDLVKKLKKDPDTRQAVLTLYTQNDGLYTQTKNVPCTIALNFLIRNMKLQLHVYMRSNDFVWGLPYDLFSFTMLQEVLANELDIDLGSYHHTVTSMHVYERHFTLLEEVDHVDEVQFVYPYGLDGIKRACALHYYLADGGDPYHKGLMFDREDELIQVLRYYASYKKHSPIRNELPSWAAPFMAKHALEKSE